MKNNRAFIGLVVVGLLCTPVAYGVTAPTGESMMAHYTTHKKAIVSTAIGLGAVGTLCAIHFGMDKVMKKAADRCIERESALIKAFRPAEQVEADRAAGNNTPAIVIGDRVMPFFREHFSALASYARNAVESQELLGTLPEDFVIANKRQRDTTKYCMVGEIEAHYNKDIVAASIVKDFVLPLPVVAVSAYALCVVWKINLFRR